MMYTDRKTRKLNQIQVQFHLRSLCINVFLWVEGNLSM